MSTEISMGKRPLTEKQQDLFDWIVDYKRRNAGASPSYREMREAMGLKSPAPVQQRLDQLERKGWIKRQFGGIARNIEIVDDSEWMPIPKRYVNVIQRFLKERAVDDVVGVE